MVFYSALLPVGNGTGRRLRWQAYWTCAPLVTELWPQRQHSVSNDKRYRNLRCGWVCTQRQPWHAVSNNRKSDMIQLSVFLMAAWNTPTRNMGYETAKHRNQPGCIPTWIQVIVTRRRHERHQTGAYVASRQTTANISWFVVCLQTRQQVACVHTYQKTQWSKHWDASRCATCVRVMNDT